jgi:hypothetical protein
MNTLLLMLSIMVPPPTQSVILAWDPSPDPTVVGYNAYYGSDSGVYTNRIDVGNVTSVVISNLSQGITYYFAVTAYNGAGLESDPSAEVSYTVPGPCFTNQVAGLTILTNVGAAMWSTNVLHGPWTSTNWIGTLWITNRSNSIYWKYATVTNLTLTCYGYQPPASNYQVLTVTGSNLQSSADLMVWFAEPSPFIVTNPPPWGFFRGDSKPTITSRSYQSP